MTTIFFVEDDIDDFEFMRDVFYKFGRDIDTRHFIDGQAFLEYATIASEVPDIIISGLRMPRKNGFELIKALKQNHLWANVPIIIFSSSSPEQEMDQVLSLGAVGYYEKPSTSHEYEEIALEIITKFLKTKISDFQI